MGQILKILSLSFILAYQDQRVVFLFFSVILTFMEDFIFGKDAMYRDVNSRIPRLDRNSQFVGFI